MRRRFAFVLAVGIARVPNVGLVLPPVGDKRLDLLERVFSRIDGPEGLSAGGADEYPAYFALDDLEPGHEYRAVASGDDERIVKGKTRPHRNQGSGGGDRTATVRVR